MKTPNHLIVVCCHAIWLGGPSKGYEESEWLIAHFQAGETPTFIQHIKAGLKTLAEGDASILMFSGGPTRKETPLSEAQSYHNLSTANSHFDLVLPSYQTRIHVEERALDSYHNVLFSILQFWRTQSFTWPTYLTIVSHGFKRERLVAGHCNAIAFPLSRVNFVGVDPHSHLDLGNSATMKGNRTALQQWAEDSHGKGDILAGKRKKRNPWGIDQRLFLTDVERKASGIATRLTDDGGDVLDDGTKPWEESSGCAPSAN